MRKAGRFKQRGKTEAREEERRGYDLLGKGLLKKTSAYAGTCEATFG